jgi:glycosyltransferase involved in cell wall biosynthesis
VTSALTQPGVDVEVIIVDDCSTDDSQRVAGRLADSEARIRLLFHERNRGHIATYNDGLRYATGDYVVLLSADDVLAPGALARACAVFEAQPAVGLVYGYAQDFSGSVPRAREAPTSWTVWDGQAWLARLCARGTNIIVNPEAMLRRPLMDELEGYDPRFPHAADMELWMRAAVRADVARVNGVDQAFYRVHGDNMHTTDYAGLLTDMAERKRVFDAFFEDPALLADAGTLVRRANRSLAVDALRAACLAADAGGRREGDDADAFAAFAVTCDPSIRTSWRWPLYESRTRRPLGGSRAWVTSRADAVRWKVRWRRWRRFGT